MRPSRLLCAGTGFLALSFCSIPGLGQGTALPKSTFEENEGGWTGFGQEAKASVTHDPANVKGGKGALQFNYKIEKGTMGALVLPTPDGVLTKMKSIKFWVKTDHTTPVMVFLQEKEGGRYVSGFTSEQDKWQRVELSAGDFNLTRGPDDPKDPNGKLDLDKVESIGLGDFGQFFIQADANLAAILNVKAGPHTLYLDEFEVSEDALPASFSAANGDVSIDSLVRPQISWIAIGRAKLSLANGKPIAGKSLQTDYHQAQGKLMGLIKSIPMGSFAALKQLSFSAASSKATKLLVQVEEKSGGKYNAMVDLEGGPDAKEIKLVFADFNQADDSKDDNNKLDLDQVHQILFLDISGLLGDVNQDNTLWIGNLHAGAIK